MAWDGSHSRGFPAKARARILRRHPTCQCTGCRHHTGRCTRLSTEADHIVPASLGGPDTEANGQGLCHDCHQSKTLTEAARARNARSASRRRPSEPHPGLRRPEGVG